MNIPLKWIKEYVDVDLDVKSLADLLTMTGTKVEGVREVGSDLKNIVVGRVLETSTHPTLTKLTIVELELGEGRKSTILTAATNVKKGDLVPAVLPGGSVAGGKQIGYADFKGIQSEGMLCSKEELGIGQDTDGILMLTEDFKPGDNLIEKLDLRDFVIEFEITPNRPDCLCVLGIAREIAAITQRELRMPDLSFKASDIETSDYLHVEVLEEDLCPRYGALIINDVTIAESPLKMQARLHYSGVRPVNNMVDITNYVMLECNQPLHAFDYSAIEDKTIQVRLARKDEKITTLDGNERELTEDTLLICDVRKPLAIAGVMGGKNSEITGQTRTVVLESAKFAYNSVWKTARRLKLRSESSARFEKGLDAETIPLATKRIAHLVTSLGIGNVTSNPIDVYKRVVPETKIITSIKTINDKLSLDLDQEIIDILESLNFEVVREEDDICVGVPSFRADVKADVDLIEEIARVYGFGNIPSIMPTVKSLGSWGPTRRQDVTVRECNVAFGAYEVQTFTLIAPQDLDDLKVPQDSNIRSYVTLSNPMSQDNSIMRTTMLPSILKVISTNYNRKNQSVNIFEIGKVFYPSCTLLSGHAELRKGEAPAVESRILAGGLTGDAFDVSWLDKARKYDFYDAKGMLEVLFSELGAANIRFVKSTHFAMHPGRTCTIYAGDEKIGALGEVDVSVAHAFDVPERTYIYEIDYEKLTGLSNDVIKVKPIPKYPAVSRDLAIVIKKDIPAFEVAEAISRCGGELIETVKIFDVYEDEKLKDKGQKSIAFSINYRAADRTLIDEDINAIQEKILSDLKKCYDATLR